MRVRLYTIGHSTLLLPVFLELLQKHEIQVLVDVRSIPFSRRMPWFTKESLVEAMDLAGRRYVWMGDVLGGRPKDRSVYGAKGEVVYDLVRKGAAFQAGMDRLLQGATEFRVAVMCAEEDPHHCHRWLMLGPAMVERGAEVWHIRGDGSIEVEESGLFPA